MTKRDDAQDLSTPRPSGGGDHGSTELTRRKLIGAGAATVATAATGSQLINRAALARERKVPFAGAGKFDLGVASGYPGTREIVLWTHIAELDRTSRLFVEVATDPGFSNVVKRRKVHAFNKRNYNIHAQLKGLKPDTEYFYRFETKRKSSEVGRFRTAPPANSKRPVRIGFFSCQNWQAGYYNAHRALAKEPDLDVVICLGDYIYEDQTYPGPREDLTGRNGDGDAQYLDEYYEKYQLYKSDRHLQAMHAAHPFVSIWDDHEVEDNYAGKKQSPNAAPGETNYGAPQRIPIAARRRNGYKAFFDYMPRKRRTGDANRTFERARFGMADLIMLDSRQYRDQQPCNDQFAQPCPESDAPGRTMLGSRQKAWFKDRLERSNAQWKILGNQLMFMSFDIAAPMQPVVVDSWDGYEAERTELMNFILDKDVKNVVALTGDIHTFFAGRGTTTGRIDGTPAIVELVGGSVTSHGVKELLQNVPTEQLQVLVTVNNPHLEYGEFESRGYGIIELREDEAICEFKAPKTALHPDSPVSTLAKFRIPNGTPDVEQI